MRINRNTIGYLQTEFHDALLKINRNPRYLRPIVAVRKDPDPAPYPWHWRCQVCPGQPDLGVNFDKCQDWGTAYTAANHHALRHQRGSMIA